MVESEISLLGNVPDIDAAYFWIHFVSFVTHTSIVVKVHILSTFRALVSPWAETLLATKVARMLTWAWCVSYKLHTGVTA